MRSVVVHRYSQSV